MRLPGVLGDCGVWVVKESETRYASNSADVAQLVEHHLAKVRVAGSNPVVRSRISPGQASIEGANRLPRCMSKRLRATAAESPVRWSLWP